MHYPLTLHSLMHELSVKSREGRSSACLVSYSSGSKTFVLFVNAAP